MKQKLDPTLKKFIRVGLFGLGAMAVMSSIINCVAAWQLFDEDTGQAIGMTRGDFYLMYTPIFIFGVGLIVGGVVLGKKK